jgi:BMFP domain-containing protein YqiC
MSGTATYAKERSAAREATGFLGAGWPDALDLHMDDMMQSKVFEDFTRLMADATEVAHGVRREAETAMKSQVERLLATMDVVMREELEAVKEMAAKAREENERLSARVAALEAEIANGRERAGN